ncbi:MAG: hypothetical protein ACRCSU_15425 [Paracoccaceae bacterium]
MQRNNTPRTTPVSLGLVADFCAASLPVGFFVMSEARLVADPTLFASAAPAGWQVAAGLALLGLGALRLALRVR